MGLAKDHFLRLILVVALHRARTSSEQKRVRQKQTLRN
jgi:hypothetical protein